MRSVAVWIVPVLLAGCGAKYKPGDAVISGYERAYKYPVHRSHEGLFYAGLNPTTTVPVVPLLAFGAAFDLDFAVMPKDGDFDMIEYARIGMPKGPQWLVLETSAASGEQTLIANLDGIDSFMPEIPLARKSGNIQVTDASTEFTLDVNIEYTNSKDQAVSAKFVGNPPKEARHRNGRTFNHSANQLLAVLDIPASESLFTGDVQIDGSRVGLKKIAGIVPGRFVLEQAQGGLTVGTFKVIPSGPAAGGPQLSQIIVNDVGAEPTAQVSPAAKLMEGVALNSATVRKCWTDRAGAAPELTGGEITFTFQVDAGTPSAAAAVPGAEGAFTDAELITCVTGAINAWTLDASVSGKATWPFTFIPGDADEETNPSLSLGTGTLEAPPAPAQAPEAAPAPEAALAPAPEGAPEEGAEAAPKTDLPTEIPLSNFTTIHTLTSGKTVEMQWFVTRLGDRVIVTQTTDLRSLVYNYRLIQGAYLELVSIQVQQYGRATPVTAITFNPPLPDVRWSFNGHRASQFVIDVNGQQGHATGEVDAYWSEAGPMLKVTPSEPDWAKSRPLLAAIQFSKDGTTSVTIERKE